MRLFYMAFGGLDEESRGYLDLVSAEDRAGNSTVRIDAVARWVQISRVSEGYYRCNQSPLRGISITYRYLAIVVLLSSIGVVFNNEPLIFFAAWSIDLNAS